MTPPAKTDARIEERLTRARHALDGARLQRLVAIEQAREAGWVWTEIGPILGISDVGARRLFTRWKANGDELVEIGRGRRNAA